MSRADFITAYFEPTWISGAREKSDLAVPKGEKLWGEPPIPQK